MVKDNTFFEILLRHPYQFSEEEFENLEHISRKYPYFQIAKAMQLKYLKERNLFLKDLLSETAAQTIDRKVLFMYIEDNKLLFKSKKETLHQANKQKQILEKNDNSIEKSVKKIVELSSTADKKPVTKSKQDKKMNYLDWLNYINRDKKEKKSKIFDAVDTFLKNKPKIVPVKHKTVKAPDIIEESVTERQMLMTETLANLYLKQKKYDKAIQAFKILILKYPKKSSYFANRISEIKQN